MPMFIPVRNSAATGHETRRDFSSWFSQVQRQQSQNTGPVPVMSEPPTTTLTKATGMATATITDAGSGYAVGDNLTPAGGNFAVPGRIRVTGVDDAGAITSAAVQQPGVYTDKPTNPVATTGGSGSGAVFILSWNAGVASSVYNGKTWSRTDASAFLYTGYNIRDTVSGYRGNGIQNGTQCIIEFMSDAPSLDFRLVGGNYLGDLYVDGQRISETSVNTDTSGAPYIYTVDWAGEVKVRAYRLVGINTGFGGVITGQAYTVQAPPGTLRPLAWQMGDSYTVGIGAKQGSYNDFRVMCDALGLDGIADGISGSGWTSLQEGRVPEWRVENKLGSITRKPQYIFFSLGYNDWSADIARVRAAFPPAVAAARRICPLAKIIVIGPATPVGSTTQLNAIREAMAEMCAGLDIAFVDVSDVVNTANKGLYTGSDRVHPSDAGHVYRGVQIAMRVSALL
ncbi:SGNH/GDSL hydrolase family protein [Salmonella enterica subsp. enterica]|nr:SGNH/GDSL hydrolase family protein [Salmonella enterica subsp. enterica serovar Veneziana]